MIRTNVYVDGFNFYYAIYKRHQHLQAEFPLGLGWCDFRKLAEQFMIVDGAIVDQIKYCTALVSPNLAVRAGEPSRQGLWLDAIGSVQGVRIIYGFHQIHDEKPREEKQTDVNIAVELILDGIAGSCERAILISGDIDLAPAVMAARERLPRGRRVDVDVWIPPGLPYQRWKLFAGPLGMTCREITAEMLAASRLPDHLTGLSGATVDCLEAWKMPTKGLAALKWMPYQTPLSSG
jgi:uncharacterized LabA/DUF88 family protein